MISGDKKLGLDKIGLKFLSGNIVTCDKLSPFFSPIRYTKT